MEEWDFVDERQLQNWKVLLEAEKTPIVVIFFIMLKAHSVVIPAQSDCVNETVTKICL